MSRRDTIIIAALINAGLLIILFVSALKNQNAPEEIAMKNERGKTGESSAVVRSEAKMVMGDEVDQVLKQYTQPDPLASVSSSTSSAKTAVAAAESSKNSSDVIALPPTPRSNFVDDLQAITQNSSSGGENFSAPASADKERSFVEVKVKKGDVLEKIARHHHTSVSEIMRLNQLSSTNLKIGQVLKVPSITVAKAPARVSTAPSAPVEEVGSAQYYTVKPGDNPWTIAVKNHMKVEDLLKLNNMDEAKARKLKPGDQIRIR